MFFLFGNVRKVSVFFFWYSIAELVGKRKTRVERIAKKIEIL